MSPHDTSPFTDPASRPSRVFSEAKNSPFRLPDFKTVSPALARDLQALTLAIGRGVYEGSLALTTGLGLSAEAVPLRLPALLAPGLELLGRLHAQGVQARYIVYQATDFIIETNGLDAEKAKTNSLFTVQYLKSFVGEFFPQLAASVQIVAGDDCQIESTHLQNLVTRLSTETTAAMCEPLAIICGYGGQHGGAGTALAYAAANAILNGGHGPHYPLAHLLPADTTTIMPIGGRRETPFFALTAELARETGSARRIVPATLKHIGTLPTYYPCARGDLVVGKMAEYAGFTPHAEIAPDFAALEKLGATRQALVNMANGLIKDLLDEQTGCRYSRRDGPTSQL